MKSEVILILLFLVVVVYLLRLANIQILMTLVIIIYLVQLASRTGTEQWVVHGGLLSDVCPVSMPVGPTPVIQHTLVDFWVRSVH